jgi:hypothetical protein
MWSTSKKLQMGRTRRLRDLRYKIIGVFANIKEANRAAKVEAFDEESDEDDEDETDVGDNASLFHWEKEAPAEWTARRVWVEKKHVQY